MRYFLALFLFLLVGCVEPVNLNPITSKQEEQEQEEQEEGRLEWVEKRHGDGWHWKILRDNKTEKEWLIIHDRFRMIVMPMESTKPAAISD